MSPLRLLLLLLLQLQLRGLQQQMFDAMLDDEPAADPAPAAAAAAAAAAAWPEPQQVQLQQRGGVAQHSELSKCRIKLAWARRRSRQQNSTTNRLARGNFATFSEHVASVSFGRKSPENSKVIMLATGMLSSQLDHTGNRSKDQRDARLYGCLAAAVGQASGLEKFLSPDAPGDLVSSISVSTFDDASMWMKDPCSKAERESGERCEGRKVAGGQLWRRGKNICLPVYNSTEAVFTRRNHVLENQQPESVLRAAVVHSPSQVLPEANTGTIANRRERWLAAGVKGAGCKVDSESNLSAAGAGTAAWHTVVVTKDNLALNDCVIGLDERVIKTRLESGLDNQYSVTTLLSLNCCGHSVVLSTQEVSRRLDGLPSHLVRMGYLHESGRISGLLSEKLVKSLMNPSISYQSAPCQKRALLGAQLP